VLVPVLSLCLEARTESLGPPPAWSSRLPLFTADVPSSAGGGFNLRSMNQATAYLGARRGICLSHQFHRARYRTQGWQQNHGGAGCVTALMMILTFR
jgi:hypothetical protein